MGSVLVGRRGGSSGGVAEEAEADTREKGGGGKGERKTDVGSADGIHVTSNYLSNGA